MAEVDWRKYPNFTEEEFRCKHTGTCRMRPDFLDILQDIRIAFGKPLVISSGYRAPSHPVELAKPKPGEHSYGVAADITISGTDALDLIVIAYGYGIRRIGVAQKGRAEFIHLGYGDKYLGFPPSIWSY